MVVVVPDLDTVVVREDIDGNQVREQGKLIPGTPDKFISVSRNWHIIPVVISGATPGPTLFCPQPSDSSPSRHHSTINQSFNLFQNKRLLSHTAATSQSFHKKIRCVL